MDTSRPFSQYQARLLSTSICLKYSTDLTSEASWASLVVIVDDSLNFWALLRILCFFLITWTAPGSSSTVKLLENMSWLFLKKSLVHLMSRNDSSYMFSLAACLTAIICLQGSLIDKKNKHVQLFLETFSTVLDECTWKTPLRFSVMFPTLSKYSICWVTNPAALHIVLEWSQVNT